jgi:hypothetical protein
MPRGFSPRGAPSNPIIIIIIIIIIIQNTGALAVEDTGLGTATGIRAFAIGSSVKIEN